MPLSCRYLDIEAVPKRAVLEQLGLLATNPEEKEKLLELASPEGADLYHEVKDLTPSSPRSLALISSSNPSAFPTHHSTATARNVH